MAGYLLLGLTLLVVAIGVVTNRDVFSPSKFYLLYLGVFFADIFRNPYGTDIHVTFLVLLGIGAMAVLLEAMLVAGAGPRRPASFWLNPDASRRTVLLLWALTALPLLAQWYMIQRAGGIAGYVNSIGMRVLVWRGLGPVRMVISVLPIINTFYFAVLLRTPRAGFKRWAVFGVHLSTVVMLGLLSGSRGGLLYTFVLLAVVFNYVRRPVQLRFAAVLGVALLAGAIVLGHARNGLRISDRGVRTGLESGVQTDAQTFRYGLIPLELVYTRDPRQLQWGMTYASAITNFVPRGLWPDKPASGGVILTRDYTNDRWRGASNLAPGVIGEGILNFGTAGIVLGSGIMFSCLVLALLIYSRMRARLVDPSTPTAVVLPIMYGLVTSAVATLLFGEFTNVFVQLLTKLVPLAGLYWLFLRVLNQAPVRRPPPRAFGGAPVRPPLGSPVRA